MSISQLNQLILSVMDALFGWMLSFPRDVSLLILGIGTAALLAFVRKFTTNQDLLKRCDHDKRTLKRRIKEAKTQNDTEAAKRLRQTRALVAVKAMKCEGRPLLIVILPLAVLGVWCFQRFEFVPPKRAEPFTVVAWFPVSATGQVAHMVPGEELRADSGWVQPIEAAQKEGEAHGRAVWTLHSEGGEKPIDLVIRYSDATFTKPVLVGQRKYSEPRTFYDGGKIHSIEVVLPKVKLFGIVPGLAALALPPWLVAYMLIAISMTFVLKRVFKVY